MKLYSCLLESTPMTTPLEQLGVACKNGDLAAVMRLSEKISPFSPENNWAILHWACTGGHLNVVQWVVNHFKLTPRDVRIYDNYMFHKACNSGHLDVAQWLVEYFGLTPEDARANDNGALKWACSSGHLVIAQWLAEHFGLTIEDAHAEDNYALKEACNGGHLATAQWRFYRRRR